MKKIDIGIASGLVAGVLNAVLTFIFKDPLIEIISTFATWVVIGFFIAVAEIKVPSAVKGIIIALMVMLPAIITSIEALPVPFIILATVLVFGSIMGVVIEKAEKKVPA